MIANNLTCKICEEGVVDIDTDSFVSELEVISGRANISTEVMGYCDKCGAEHKYTTSNDANVIANKSESVGN